jgi:hypothetical protein
LPGGRAQPLVPIRHGHHRILRTGDTLGQTGDADTLAIAYSAYGERTTRIPGNRPGPASGAASGPARCQRRRRVEVTSPPGGSGRPEPRRGAWPRRRPGRRDGSRPEGRSGRCAAWDAGDPSRRDAAWSRTVPRPYGPGPTGDGTGIPDPGRTLDFSRERRMRCPGSRHRLARTPGLDHGTPLPPSFTRECRPGRTTTAPPTGPGNRTG